MPKPDFEVPTPENCIGYGAVIVADLDEYQGFFIIDNPDMNREATTVMMFAMASGVSPIGALQAVIVESVLTKDWPRVGVAALALTGLTKEKFFVIHGTKEPEGTRTHMVPLTARSVEDARAEIEAMPEVVELKSRLMSALRGPKQ